ncbi:MAG: hypothetical protein IKG42_01675 [Clostridia bacterium]|nr:hypothetical protein [Clostridia bacterium]
MNNDEILKRIFEKVSNIEDYLEEINQNIGILLEENEDNKLEHLMLMTRFENLADFIKDKYNVVLEENEEYLTKDCRGD